MLKAIFGAIVGLAVGALIGVGIKNYFDQNEWSKQRFSRLPVLKDHGNYVDHIQDIDIAPIFPTMGAVIGSLVGAIGGAASTIVSAIRSQPKGTSA